MVAAGFQFKETFKELAFAADAAASAQRSL
jgi:hypothetical protein